jgi:hypothetical protein
MARPLAKPRLVLVALLLAALGIAMVASVSGATTAGDSARKCGKGRVLVKVNKRPSCQPLRSVLPKPKAGDRRLIALREALTVEVSKLKGRRGKRARKLPPRAAAAARKARKISLRAAPKLIAMLNRLEQRAGPSARRRHARPVASKAPCGGPGSAVPDSETGRTGGAGLQGTLGPNGEEGGVITVPVNGFTVVTTFTKCGNGTYYVLGCPHSNGDAPTSSRGSYDVTTRIMDGKTLIRSDSTTWRYEDKLLGKVKDDAQLDYFDFTRKEQKLTVATGGFVQGGSATRTLRVRMPGGAYDASHSSVNITGDAQAFKDDDLAASIAMAKKEYLEAQNGGGFLHTDGWATFERQGRDPYCAKAVFSPASDAVKLKKGRSEAVSVYAQGYDGNRATGARWTILDQHNAIFPGSVSGASPSIGYSVSAVPVGDRVRMTVKFTSTAGVGKDTWTEPIAELPTINHLNGTFSGSYSVPTILGPSIVSWTGTARFDRSLPAIYGGASGIYALFSGGYDITASGIDGSFATGCQQSGTKHIALGGPGSGFFEVNSVAVGSFDPPYDYSIQAAPLGPQQMDITRHSCPPGAEEWEGTSGVTAYFPTPLDTLPGPHVSDDGIVYNGSTNDNQGGLVVTQSWNFTGTE